MNELKKLYYDYGYTSENKLYRIAKENNISVTHKQVKEFLDAQETAQLTRQRTKTKVFNSIVAGHPKEQYMMDLMIYDRFEYHKYKYIWTCIDIYSRFAMAVPLTTKRFDVIMNVIKETWEKYGKPEIVQCDNEFNNSTFIKYCQDNNIKVIFSQPNDVKHNAIIERWHLTISKMIQRWRIATHNYDWASVLPKLIETYNRIYHKTIKAKPVDVFTSKDTNHQDVIRVTYTYKAGDKVRVKMRKQIFEKGDAIAYSKEVYEIEKKQGQRYKLKGVDELFRPQDLKLIKNVEKAEIVPSNENEEVEHKQTQRRKRIQKMMNKEQIKEGEFKRPQRPKREWVPSVEALHSFAQRR